MSRVLPILFNTDMVRAILDGRKEITRRLVKLPKYIQKQENGLYTLFAEGACYEEQDFEQIIDYLKKPYKPGDILYVRETWCKGSLNYQEEKYYYKANKNEFHCRWYPSIHMPKEVARIWLKVKNVRVERLQEITNEEVKREGIQAETDNSGQAHRFMFSELWNSTIKKSDLDRYDWKSNPWVWVIEFERCEKPQSI